MKDNHKRIGILADCHFPIHDQKLLDRACGEIKDRKCDTIVLDGDILDFPTLSKFQSVPAITGSSIDQQLNSVWSFLCDLRKENPHAEIFYIEGNHDFRIRSLLIRATQGLSEDIRHRIYARTVEIEKDLDLTRLKIKWIGTQPEAAKWTDTYIDFGGLIIGHFDTVSNPVIPAGSTIRNIMQKKIRESSVVQAHIHRAALLYDTNDDGSVRFGMETPCLCKDAFYKRFCNWQRGYSIIEKVNDVWIPELHVFN